MDFRQMGSLTPGHSEYGHTVGVEATTGPLGVGMGMVIAEAHLAEVFNKENYPVVDHYTFVLGGDGCLMEGISSEAFSLAGTLGLGKLIVLYDLLWSSFFGFFPKFVEDAYIFLLATVSFLRCQNCICHT